MSDNRTFWLVWNEYGGVPVVKHLDHETAKREAERLARNSPGQRFWVMRSQAVCCKSDVEWTAADVPDTEIPF